MSSNQYPDDDSEPHPTAFSQEWLETPPSINAQRERQQNEDRQRRETEMFERQRLFQTAEGTDALFSRVPTEAGTFLSPTQLSRPLQERMQAAMQLERPLRISVDTRARDPRTGQLTSWGVDMHRCENVLLGRQQTHLNIQITWSQETGNWICTSTSQGPTSTQ